MYIWSAVEQVIEELVMQGLVMQGQGNIGKFEKFRDFEILRTVVIFKNYENIFN